MAKFELRPGNVIDLLTQGELDISIERLETSIDHLRDDSWTQRAVGFETVDANGNIGGGTSGAGAILYTVPAGFEAFLHRLNINSATSLTAGSLVICRNGNVIPNVEYFFPVPPATVVTPQLVTEGSNGALWLKSNDNLVIAGSGLTVGAEIFVSMQLKLWPAGKSQRGR